MGRKPVLRIISLVVVSGLFSFGLVYATPSTHIWAPSTDIQPYGKIHAGSDFYFPTTGKDSSDNHLHVQQVYGLTFSLLSDKPENNLLGKLWSPLGKIMAETGFDYKKGFGSVLDTYPWYFHFKLGVPEDAYFKNMPAFAAGIYDVGTKKNKTDNNIWYFKAGKTVSITGLSLGRFSLGYFWGNGKLLVDEEGLRDNHGVMACWERTMSEISDKLWLAVDYQASHSGYGTLNLGFAWKFTNNVAAILGYDIYNNRNNTDSVTLQVDVDF